MKPCKSTVLALAPLCLLAGCGAGDSGAKKAPMPMEETVYGEQIKQMNRIRDQAQKLSGERMDNLNKQLDKSEE